MSYILLMIQNFGSLRIYFTTTSYYPLAHLCLHWIYICTPPY